MPQASQTGKLTLVIGGTRSGKSQFAEELAAETGRQVVYIATAQALDQEMTTRIQQHRARRPDAWQTVEETHHLSACIAKLKAEVILLDCLTLLISNLLLDDNFPSANTLPAAPHKQEAILAEVEALARNAATHAADVIVVSSEVGMGLVPESELSRIYRDLVGTANQIFAGYAEAVYYVIAGQPVELKHLAQLSRSRRGGEERFGS